MVTNGIVMLLVHLNIDISYNFSYISKICLQLDMIILLNAMEVFTPRIISQNSSVGNGTQKTLITTNNFS